MISKGYSNRNRTINSRILVTIFFSVVLIITIIIKLWDLQIVKQEKFRGLSEQNRIRNIRIPAARGMIFDRNGNLLVGNKVALDVSIIPIELSRKRLLDTLKKLSSILKVSVDDMLVKIKKKAEAQYEAVILKENVSETTIVYIDEHKTEFPAVIVSEVPQRYYLYNEIAANMLGYINELDKKRYKKLKNKGYHLGDKIGLSGIEKQYEKYLRGVDGLKLVEVNVHGQQIKQTEYIEPIPGDNLYLTIDIKIQKKLEKLFKDRYGASVLIHPDNGEVIAMVSKPSFNPNVFSYGIDSKLWHKLSTNPNHPLVNKTISQHYPPGSTFKPLVALAGLGDHIIGLSEQVYCTGALHINDLKFRCWKKTGHETMSLIPGIVQSCDVYMYTIGDSIGNEIITKYAKLFGFGQKSGIDLPFEIPGLVPEIKWFRNYHKRLWSKGDNYNYAIGQGDIVVTPLQLANFIAALSSYGKLYKPYVVKKITDHANDTVYIRAPELIRQINIPQRTFKIINMALYGVVNSKHGTAKWSRLKKIPFAGKTGTAQVIATEDDIDTEKIVPAHLKPHSLFIGYAKYSQPEIASAVIAENSGHGSVVAAPITKYIYKYIFKNR